MPSSQFSLPNCDEPLDVHAACSAIPDHATITGMFPNRMVHEAAKVGEALASSRSEYVSFEKYPLREHAELVVQALPIFHPNMSARAGLRRLGRGGPVAFLDSIMGKVTLGSVDGVHAAIDAMVKAYQINMDPGDALVTERSEHHAIVRMTDIHYFLDSHHVGSFEGLLWAAGIRRGKVRIRSYSSTMADLLLEW